MRAGATETVAVPFLELEADFNHPFDLEHYYHVMKRQRSPYAFVFS
jgi:hypothetical protein